MRNPAPTTDRGERDTRYARVIVVTASGEGVSSSLVEHLRASDQPVMDQNRALTCGMPYRESDARPLQFGDGGTPSMPGTAMSSRASM